MQSLHYGRVKNEAIRDFATVAAAAMEKEQIPEFL